MNRFSHITNTYSDTSPEYILAQNILRFEANRLSKLRKVNKEFGWISVTVPKHLKRKRKLSLCLRGLLP